MVEIWRGDTALGIAMPLKCAQRIKVACLFCRFSLCKKSHVYKYLLRMAWTSIFIQAFLCNFSSSRMVVATGIILLQDDYYLFFCTENSVIGMSLVFVILCKILLYCYY